MKNKVPSKTIEIEIEIKLLEYLKRKGVMEDEMYNTLVSKFIKRSG